MRLNESRTRSFQAPVTIHNYPGRQVYVFPNGRSDSEESSEEELNVTELRPRGKEQQRCSTSRDRVGDVVLLEREITEDDNLNKLALQYGCKVADIKRVNNFIQDQDLYALKSIKIPVKTHGLLTEKGRELRLLSTVPSQTGLTLVDLPEPDDGASSSADGRHLSDYFKGIDKSIQDAVQVEVQLNAEYCMEALERPLPESGKQETSNGGAHCRICAVARVLLVQSQYFSMTAGGQRVLEEDVSVALGLWYVVHASQRLVCWGGGLASITLKKKKKSIMVHLKHPISVMDLSVLVCSLHVSEHCHFICKVWEGSPALP
ncbi:lysM and putative peptidoglycan-binding domain-containing protein 4 isoform X1 [Harpia harpyja]|uniref:lysM and putative peptidoglycan-binding domain-containing protein 4 isoform X1 n=2 Tax=Harpia harpyja TaxID=202280 RepID=UPI0022B18AD4|nr:lysM and putative peptidoglycan-binding domain-containing protein 4 isoform X1 [Harpia harpyja]XP_052664079.1 lysM and putative peptidoglycan-binding domain-containing protein 4 isoform X1 [Harpia harpyja]XP_052664081.1 lysM and putative peptidoglycan-binding domain-containing protein 4 isoform X1 [Harpia harpyja]XP_052664082.1 lysM and putative peptidoglycan-binding domain-containing protein 4 isoform X1 [Harpia harpyja]XP_052664083.1 lysM and putative peptidoglycan-binding domain-containin